MKETLKDHIDRLREEGFEVEILHFRTLDPHGFLDDPKGGHTISIIKNKNGDEIARARAICRKDENYNKKLGGSISLGRAEKELRNK